MSGARYHQAPYNDQGGDYGRQYASGTASPYKDGGGYDHGYSGGAGGGYAGTSDYPMSSSNPYATTSSEPRGYPAKKKRRGLWWAIAAVILLLVIAGAVLGGIFGSRAANKNKGTTSGSDKATGGTGSPGTGGGTGNGDSAFHSGTKGADSGNTGLPTLLKYYGTNMAVQTQTGANGQIYLPVATDTYELPAYATGTFTDHLPVPTKDASPGTNGAWPSDSSPGSTGNLRADRPRIIAPKYKWDALKAGMIDADPYLHFWSAQILANATDLKGKDAVKYAEDGGLTGSGILDVSREVKQRVKNLGYAYRITGDTSFADRAWLELSTASCNAGSWGHDGVCNASSWNGAGHFLDTAEMTAAFAIGYDWMYDAWTDDQKTKIRTAIWEMGVNQGISAYAGTNGVQNWWIGTRSGTGTAINGNWNCVCNAGMILGALAILGEDASQTAALNTLISNAVSSSKDNCFQAPSADGTWAETANYWYFGTTGAAEMVSALQTSYNDDQGLAASNPGFNLTSLYHIYAQGMTSLFNYGDHGPNKFSSTANSLLLWATTFNQPRYALYQRDHVDAAEPFSMFWYDPTTEGAWWNELPLDHHFDAELDNWATARSSWSDNSGTYWAMKGGKLVGHQTHGDLDLGDFVFDAMGQRWAGELGSDQYLGTGYFNDEDKATSNRWNYYRKRTEGQNTILINHANQQITASGKSLQFGSTGTSQGSAPSLTVAKEDSAFFTVDISSGYDTGVSVKRGIRFINGRLQMLLQDEVSGVATGQSIMWRMHTNATVDASGDTATLSLGDQKLVAKILNPTPAGLTFGTMKATPLPTDTNVPADAIPNPETVLTIENANGGSMNVQVLFTPQWPGKSDSDYVTAPPNVALDSWSLSSHN